VKKSIIALSILAFGITAALSATSQTRIVKKASPAQKKLQLAIKNEMRQYLRTDGLIEKYVPVAASANKALTDADVGDAGSFGRNVQFMGSVQSGVVTIAADCTPDPMFPPGPNDKCVTPDVNGFTSFNYPDMGKTIIPAKTAKTLFCHWQTPFGVMIYGNSTGVYQSSARTNATATYKIENAVLADPALIDPTTGLPFGGSLSVALSAMRDSRGLQPGDSQVYRDTFTRVCNGGLVSKRALIETYGLTETQAKNFFKNDSVITLGVSGSTRYVTNGSLIIGTRFVGD
jgi:hypothetical protein